MRDGIDNLLTNCMDVQPGQDVMIIYDPQGYFSRTLVDEISRRITSMRAQAHILESSRIDSGDQMPPFLLKAMETAHHTLFFHSLGSMLRFVPVGGNGTLTISFIVDDESMQSTFSTTHHGGMQGMTRLLHESLAQAKQWRIRCPLGTDLSSIAEFEAGKPPTDNGDGFTLQTFPIGSHRPFLCRGMQGTLAITRLISSGVHAHKPVGITLDSPVLASIKDGVMTDFDGDAATVRRVRDHYDMVGDTYGYDQDRHLISSWHAGTHPQGYCLYDDISDYERWLLIAHNNPRMAHFHSCGNFNPGEVTLPIIDPTIEFDDTAFWQDGKLAFLEREDVRSAISQHADVDAFTARRTELGIPAR